MSNHNHTKHTTPAERKAVVERFLASGKSREAFAGDEKITKSTLDRWLSQVRPSNKRGELYEPLSLGEEKRLKLAQGKKRPKKTKTEKARLTAQALSAEASMASRKRWLKTEARASESALAAEADAVVSAAIPAKLVRRFVHAVLECGTLGEAREAFKLAVGKIERLRK